MVKNLPANARGVGLISGSGDALEKEMANPLQYFCLENPMDKGTWQATVHDAAKSVRHNLATKRQGVTKLLVSLF